MTSITSCVNRNQLVDDGASLLDAQVFENLISRVKTSASYNSWERQTQTACLPGTRAVVLDQIYKWVDSSDDRAVFWLSGPGGSGKTTIATTIAAKYAQENRLAGSFFFSRDSAHHRQSTNGVIATIAYQNSISHPVVWNRIKRVLDSDPDIFTKPLKFQFDRLIIGPVRRRRWQYLAEAHRTFQSLCEAWVALNLRLDVILPGGAQTFCEVCIAFLSCIIFYPPIDGVTRLVIMMIMAASFSRLPTIQTALQISFKTYLHLPPLLVIIDALDECDGSAKSLIKVIADDYRDSPAPIRFFLTSRRDEQTAEAFRLYHDRIHFMSLMDSPAQDDIRLFLQKELNNLTIKHLQYLGFREESWLSPSDIDSLVKKSQGLFIYAATLVNFLGDMDQGEIPVRRLRRAMLQNDGLDGLYLQVLQAAPEFPNPDFHRVLGAICFLYNELPLGSLAVLLRLDSAADARRILRGCRSIFHIPQTDHESITFFHTSLRDFLTGRYRSQNYTCDHIDDGIDPMKQHLSLLYDCVQLIVTESQVGLIYESNQVNYSKISANYARENWHRHLIDLQPSGRGTVDLLKMQFGERYESLFLYFLDRLEDGTLQGTITWSDLEPNLLRLEDEELSDRLRRIRRFNMIFPGAYNFEIEGSVFSKALARDIGDDAFTKCQYNVAVVIGDKSQTEQHEQRQCLDPEKWRQFVSKANILVAKKNGVDVISDSERPEDNQPPEPEHQLKTQQVQKHLIIYTGVDTTLKTLERSIDVIFTLTPPTAESNRPWPAIVWKTLHFEKTTSVQNEIRWSSQSGFCVVEELDDGTLRPGSLGAVVEPGYAAILQNVHNERDFSEQLAISFATDDVAVCDMTGSRLRLALCSIDPSKEESDFWKFSPVIDLESATSSGGLVFACTPPIMLQAYAVSGYKDGQPISPLKLLSPLFINAITAEPQAIDLSKLERPVTTFRLYSGSTGRVTLEEG